MRVGAMDRLFKRFDAVLNDRGYLAIGGQIVDATVIEARRPRLTQAEVDTIKDAAAHDGAPSWPVCSTRTT